MKVPLANFLMWLTRAHEAADVEDKEDREDIAYIEMARKDASFRPLREVLGELEPEERGELRRPIRQTG